MKGTFEICHFIVTVDASELIKYKFLITLYLFVHCGRFNVYVHVQCAVNT